MTTTTSTSLTLAEARERRALIDDVEHDIHLDLRDDDGGTFLATTVLRVRGREGAEIHLDLQHATDVAVELNGETVPTRYERERVRVAGLTGGADEITVRARMPYVTDGDGMHRFVDPEDDASYVGCYGGMDVNRRVFACVDQPDIKGPWTVTVDAPEHWTVVSNGVASREGGRWTFATTPPIASYLVTVCAGPFVSRTWEYRGLPFGWHARASLAEDLDRDLDDLRQVTEGCFDYYAERFEEPYPFDSYEQVLVPGHNWGAMECPGAVTIRDELLPRGVTDPGLRRNRAGLIAHEMAHMWFGDLVTFRWWEDTWLNESFADYLGFLVSGAVQGGESALAEFDLSRKLAGYAADRRPSTHPVAPRPEDVPDVDAAFNNFDQISYAKGNSCLRQLAFWLGEETFFAGVNRHLTSARFGTADLDDFVASLQAVTEADVSAWVEAWLRTTGHDTLTVERTGDGIRLHPSGDRPHRVRVVGYDCAAAPAVAFDEVVSLEGGPVELPAADLVIPNATGDTFAVIELDEASREAMSTHLGDLPDLHPRIILWAMLLDEVARGAAPVAGLVDLVERHLPGETSAVICQRVLDKAVQLVQLAGPADQVADLAERLAATALTVLGRGGHEDAPALDEGVRTAAVQTVLATTHDADLVRSWLAGEVPGGRELTRAQRWVAVRRLARLDALDEELLAAETAADGSDAGRLAVLSARAAVPTAEAKAEALDRMLEDSVSNREFVALANGLWDAERRDLVDPLVDRFLAGAPAMAARGQAMGMVVGQGPPPVRWSSAQLDALEAALNGPDVTSVLARSWGDFLSDQRGLSA